MDSLIKLENFALIPPFAELFQQGVIVTVLLSVFTVMIGFVLAVILALMRLSNFHPFYFLGLTKDGRLRDGGCKLFVATSKPIHSARMILEYFDFAKYFDYIFKHSGETDLSRTLMVGDNPVTDVDGAVEYGMVGALFGHRWQEESKATYRAATMAELEKLLFEE